MNNIFEDFKQKITTIKTANAKTAGKQLVNAIEKEENNSAKMWLIFSAVLVIASMITGYVGYKYYRFSFDPSSPSGSFAMSVAITAVVEVVKVALSYAVLSAFIFGWAWANWSKFFGYSFAFALAGGCFYWSYSTSTEGVAIYAKETSTDALTEMTLSQYLADGTRDIDAQIATITSSNDDARKMTTKKGKVNWYGQQAISNNSTTLSTLQQSRADLVKTLTEKFNAGEAHINAKTNKLAEWVQTFGGLGEWATLFCLLALIFFDKDANDELMSTESAQKVAAKIKEHGAKLNAEQMEEELAKAATMNGTYKTAPLPGK